MTLHLLRLLCLCPLAWMSPALAGVSAAPTTTPPPLLPMPAQLQRTTGSFTVDAHTPIRVADPSAATRRTAEYLAGLGARTRGLQLSVKTDPLAPGQLAPHAIVLRRDRQAPLTNREGYALDVTPAGIRLTARDDAGLFYGAVTLWQLLTPDAQRGAVRLPTVRIRDQPRFVWRGLMLDSARHFQSVADIRQLLDWMALHKLNVLHWHLTDDQGWRLQIKRYPELTRIGSCRRAVGPDAALTGGADTPYCGYYTQKQVRELVRYAAARYITIVPEIEMPGHAQAAIAAYPSLGVTGKRPPVSTDWGVHMYLYNADDRTVTFLHNVLDEVMALFPSTYIHIGGDEAVKDQWQASPAIQARMRQLGISDEDALQSWLIRHMERYLAAHGRKLIGWDEILEGGLPADATVMSWRGIDGAITAANQGHDVVLSPSPTLYLDNLQSDHHDEPAGRAQVQSLRDIYDFNPIPAAIEAAQGKHVLGAQVNLWTEYMPTFARAQHAIFPRLAALAELDWSPAAAHDWPGFLARLPAQFARYRALGIDYADSAFAPQFALTAATATGKINVSVTDQTGSGVIRYSTDGSTPSAASTRYTGPLTLSPPLTVQAATFDAAGQPLASARAQRLDFAALHTRNSDQLATCNNNVVLRLEDDRPLHGPRPVYKVNIMDTCWIWKGASLAGRRQLAVTVGNLPWNYQLAHDINAVVVRPPAGQDGELDVHLDHCDGPRIARMSLQHAAASKLQTTLTATLPATTGQHDLCLIVSGDPKQGLWAIDTVALSP